METPQRRGNSRRAIRKGVKGSTKVKCYSGAMGLGPNLATVAVDVSETGARLRVKVEMRKGQEVEVTLDGIGQPRPLVARGEVVWCVPSGDGGFIVGVCFRRPLEYRALGDL